MNRQRIEAVVYRHLYSFKRNYDRLSDSIYWPVMDLMLWGLTTAWLRNSGATPSHLLLIMLTAIVFWQVVWRANYEISVNLLEETWNRNFVNLFSTPLTVFEWISGVMIVGSIKVLLTMVVGVLASLLLYHLNILTVGPVLVPYLASLIVFGWSLGLFASGMIVRFGKQIQSVAWMMGFLFAPLSAVYYPVSTLPAWLQPLSYLVPASYVFEGMRKSVQTGAVDFGMLLSSLVLNCCYLTLAGWFFVRMFEKRRITGLHGMD